MVSKSQIKLITSLQQKKYRDTNGLFIAEGQKLITELMEEGLNLHSVFGTSSFMDASEKFSMVTERELQKLSALKKANGLLAVFEIPKPRATTSEGLILALDAIRDPGNLGTIIRLCDWFGVEQLVCSKDTADCYNPKVVQASMGSIARVHIQYTDLSEYIKNMQLPVYGGVLNGNNIYSEETPENAIVIMGNEANGISDELIALLSHKITIPQFGKVQKTESLNVATATAILLSEFRR
ncbi:TrmH family RNA methyltransferase [Ulvibacter antarcticus]|uniref:TrmH family RNA methyltransferase n=1 Tax=Ulvibacter antarcticus TaxID=442714 RepID=A0A3L9YE50_9FLAO|nr:RNA methyltransferase [Ulvibacter antarcticus]RMA57727.1 TrmH family RNA methyltransferase [Ulvibacter antarcticus]